MAADAIQRISPRWTPIGDKRGPLLFGSADEPRTSASPHCLEFAEPMTEDDTHMSAFYFECAEARGHAAAALGADGPVSD